MLGGYAFGQGYFGQSTLETGATTTARSELPLVFQVRGLVNVPLSLNFDVLKSVRANHALQYDVFQLASSNLQLDYDLLQLATRRSLSLSWDTDAVLRVNLHLKWDLAAKTKGVQSVLLGKETQKALLLFLKQGGGTPITLEWTEWSDNKTVDPTTGATPETPGILKTASTTAIVSSVQASKVIRMFSEVGVGNRIIDFAIPLIRITDAGGTDLEVGDVLDQFALNRANRQYRSPATGVNVDLQTLHNLSIIIKGVRWRQKPISPELLALWQTEVGGFTISQSILVQRA